MIAFRLGRSSVHAACWKAFSHGLLTLCLLGCALAAFAQKARYITFDAPGADLTAGSYNGTYPGTINNFGAIAGTYEDANSVYHGFLRTPNGAFTTFEAPGADTTPNSFNGTNPNSINDLGVITGSYSDATSYSHGFLRTPDGKFITFDVPGAGGYGTIPTGINLEGAVVGYYTDADFVFHAFLRNPIGKFTTFVGPGACATAPTTGCYANEATTINFFGVVAGNYMDASGNFVEHGLIRQTDGTLISYEAPGAGTGYYQGTGCAGCFSGLNESGAIASTFTDANNVYHGFVRSPRGVFTTFEAPGAGTGAGQGTGCFSDCAVIMNDEGALTGIDIDGNNVYHGYLRSPDGKMVTIDPAGSTFTQPSGLNDLGAITGLYLDGNNVYHGFLRLPQ